MFKKLIRTIVHWANNDNSYTMVDAAYSTGLKSSRGHGAVSSSGGSISDTETGFNFIIYNANGGKVVQCWHYDKVTDKQRSNLYLLHADDDLATELSMIITKESLSR